MPEAIIQLQYPVSEMDKDITGAQEHSAGITAIFEQVFKEHFKSLHQYACGIVRDEASAEEIVQQVFYKLWEIRDRVALRSVAAYLYRSVYYESLNFLKHKKIKAGYSALMTAQNKETEMTGDPAMLKELQERITKALNALPEQCRTIFQMSRYEEMKYRDIADRLGISVKTVETQMCKALKILRSRLADYLPVLCLLIVNMKK